MSASDLPPWPGDCFQRAALEMMRSRSNPDIRLVHGEVESSYEPGKWVAHAWCEIPAEFEGVDEETGERVTGIHDFAVIDTCQPDPKAHITPRDFYYEKCKPRNVRRYTFREMIEKALHYQHDGPWYDN